MITSDRPDTRLRGRWIIVARLAWILITLFYLGSFLAALPTTLAQKEGFAQQSQDWPEPDLRSSLTELGISYDAYVSYDTWSNLAITFVMFGLGIFIYWRRSDDWIALLFSLLFLTFPGTKIFETLAQIHPAWNTVKSVSDSLTSINSLSLLIFPDGRFVPRWTSWVALGFAGIQIWRLIQPVSYREIAFIALIPLVVCIILGQIYRFRRVSTPSQQQQTKWVVFGLVVGFTPFLLYLLVWMSNPAFSKPGALGMAMHLLGNLVWSFAVLSLIISFTLAILRSRLWDIDLLIRRTLVYGALTGALALVYFGSVLLLQGVLGRLTRVANSPLAIVVSTLLVAAMVTPLRRRIQNDIDRRFYRQKYNAELALAKFAVVARSETDQDRLVSELLAVVRETMQPEQASLWWKPASRGRLPVSDQQREP